MARRPVPERLPLGRVALALLGSGLGHGAVLAAAFLGLEARPPEPLPAFAVEIVALEPADGDQGSRPSADPAAPSAPSVAPADGPSEPAPDALAGAPRDPPAATAAAGPVARPARPRAAQPRPRPPSSAPAQGPPPGEAVPPAVAAPGPPAAEPALALPAAEGAGGAPAWRLGSLDNPVPRYPSAARRRGIEGTVTLAVQVSPVGLPTEVVVARSSGSELLDRAALEAVGRWRFRPAEAVGRPVEASLLVPIAFRLLDP